MAEESEQYKDEEYELLFSIRKSIRYHIYRKRFFDSFNNITAFVSVISGTATFAAVLAKAGPNISLACAAVVAIASTIDLIIGSSQAARHYDDLAKRFIKLEKAIISNNIQTMDAITCFKAERLDIEIDEPPKLRILNAVCYNETCRSLGLKDSEIKVGFFQRLLKHYFDFMPSTV